MESIRMRASLRDSPLQVRRTFAFPADVKFIDLHLIIQAMAGWGGENSHRFAIGSKRIGAADFGVLEEADESVSDYVGTRPVYTCGPFTVDLMFLKGRSPDIDSPVIQEAEGYFPPEECKSMEEYDEVLSILEDPQDPSYGEIASWMRSVEECQDTESVNREFSEKWERIGKINGRIPFNVAAAAGALLITGIDDYYYDTQKRILTEESDGSDRFIPVRQEDSFVDTLAGMYCDMMGIENGNLALLLEDAYRQGWEEYAENFLDEIVDHWADAHGYIVESYADSDISKMMSVFGGEE